MVALEVPQGYAVILLLIIVSAFQLIMAGFAAMGPRKKVFTKEFFEKNFPEELKAGKIDLKAGYPDVGSGKYAMALTHDQWKDVNNAQRAHVNFLEVFAPMVAFFLIGGLSFPRVIVLLQLVNIVGRFLYQTMYASKGPQGRLMGALLNLASMLGAFLTAIVSAVSLCGGVEGLVAFATGTQ